MLRSVNDVSFQTMVREYPDPAVVLFTDDESEVSWRVERQVIHPAAQKWGGNIIFYRGDYKENRVVLQELNIHDLPSLVLFDGGMIRSVHTGTITTSDLRLWIQENV